MLSARDLARADATKYAELFGYPDRWRDAPPRMLEDHREDIRQMLMHEYDDLGGDEIATVMDEALYDLEFPFERLP